jgi:hypothetical protein
MNGVKPIKWESDWNRPLSPEERAIARRLGCAPKDTYEAPAPKPRQWFDVEIEPLVVPPKSRDIESAARQTDADVVRQSEKREEFGEQEKAEAA